MPLFPTYAVWSVALKWNSLLDRRRHWVQEAHKKWSLKTGEACLQDYINNAHLLGTEDQTGRAARSLCKELLDSALVSCPWQWQSCLCVAKAKTSLAGWTRLWWNLPFALQAASAVSGVNRQLFLPPQGKKKTGNNTPIIISILVLEGPVTSYLEKNLKFGLQNRSQN